MRTTISKSSIGALAFLALAAFAAYPPPAPAVAQTTAPGAAATINQTTIRALQEALNKQGVTVAVDGVLGEATRAAIRKYQTQHHLPVSGEPDKATLDKLGVAAAAESSAPAGASTQQAPTPTGGMMGSGMMNPGMMNPGMMGSGTMGSDTMSHMSHMMQMMGGQMGGGMMGGQSGQSGGMPGMGMGGAMMGGQMGGMGMRSDTTMGMGRMHGMHGMSGGGMGMMPGLIYGTPSGEMTTDRVSKIVDGLLAWHGNPRLKLGKVAEDGGEIVAEIVTQDGSLVQKLAFNRYPGVVRQAP